MPIRAQSHNLRPISDFSVLQSNFKSKKTKNKASSDIDARIKQVVCEKSSDLDGDHSDKLENHSPVSKEVLKEFLVEKHLPPQPGKLKRSLICHVYAFALAVFIQIKRVILFPTRYFGSKTWSIPGLMIRLPFVLLFGWMKKESICHQLFGNGYSYRSKSFTKEQAKPFLRNACIASAIAAAPNTTMPRRMEEEWLDPFNLKVLSPREIGVDLTKVSGAIEADDKRFLDRKSGLKMMVVVKDNEAIFTFGAAAAVQHEFPDAPKNPEWKALNKRIWNKIVWPNLLGASPPIYKQAESLYLAVKDSPALKGKEITLVGHCMGGSLASYIGIKQCVKAQGFNTLAFGVGIQRQIGDKKLRQAKKYVTHLSIKNDFFSDCPKISTLDRIFNHIGIGSPGNFGDHGTIPAYSGYNLRSDGCSLNSKNQDRIHNYYVGSLMAYLGYSNRDKPVSLAKQGVDLSQF